MKNGEAAIRKEIKDRAAALAVTAGLADIIVVIMAVALRDSRPARITLLVLTGIFTLGLILSILAIVKPLSFKWMFHNLRAERTPAPRQKPKKPEYEYDREYGFISNVFKRPVSVSAANVSADYVKKCIGFFQNLSNALLDALAGGAMQYYRDITEASGEPGPGMPDTLGGREILDWIYPKVMWIGNGEATEGPEGVEGAEPVAFIVECDCAWEQEHGLEIIAYDGEIIHVGSYDGDLDYWKEQFAAGKKK